MVNLDNIEEIMAGIDKDLKAYYARLYSTDQDIEAYVKLGSSLSVMHWFISSEEAKAKSEMEVAESVSYSNTRKENPKATIPDIANMVSLGVAQERLRHKTLSSALKSLDKILMHLAIRIKSLQKETSQPGPTTMPFLAH